MGDFFSHDLQLGHVRGLPLLAAAFAIVFRLGRRARTAAPAYYWLAIVIVRTAATNLADLATHDFSLACAWVITGLAVLLAISLYPVANARRPGPSPDGWFWASMLIAGTLGTAVGDGVADDLDLGTGVATLLLGAATAALLGAWTRLALPIVAVYWAVVVAIRAAGTTASDFLAGREGLGLGLSISTILTGLLLLGILLLWRRPATGLATVLE